jgi:hypothetical protein
MDYPVEIVGRQKGNEVRLGMLRLPDGALPPRVGERLRLRLESSNEPGQTLQGTFTVDDLLWEFTTSGLEKVKLYVDLEHGSTKGSKTATT